MKRFTGQNVQRVFDRPEPPTKPPTSRIKTQDCDSNRFEQPVREKFAEVERKIINRILNTITRDWSYRQYGSYPDYVREKEEEALKKIFNEFTSKFTA